MTPAAFVALAAVAIAGAFDLRAAALLACGLSWIVSGRSPLYLIEHSAKWLRVRLKVWLCLAAWHVLHRLAGVKELRVEEGGQR